MRSPALAALLVLRLPLAAAGTELKTPHTVDSALALFLPTRTALALAPAITPLFATPTSPTLPPIAATTARVTRLAEISARVAHSLSPSAGATASDAHAAGRALEEAVTSGADGSGGAPASALSRAAVWTKSAWNRFAAPLRPKTVTVALCQFNPTVGDFQGNVAQMLSYAQKAGESGAKTAVFPEMSLTGYPPRDRLESPHFIEDNERALEAFLEGLRALPRAPETVIVGSIVRNPDERGKPLINAAVTIRNGRVVSVQPKRLLPDYDVFDETRYFAAGRRSKKWKAPWGCLGTAVCEDAWAQDAHQGRRLYDVDPARDLRGADLVAAVNASPFEIGKQDRRKALVGGFARRARAPVAYVNQVGGQDNLVFDGGSMILSRSGEVLFELPQFEEGIGIAELRLGRDARLLSSQRHVWNDAAKSWGQPPAPDSSDMAVLERALVTAIRDYFHKNGFAKVVIGLSGGIDSSVVASLAVKALGAENVVGVLMPSKYSSEGSLVDAQALARNLGLAHIISPIQKAVDAILAGLELDVDALARTHAKATLEDDTMEDNVQARLRGMIVMAITNKFKGFLALNTSNKSEMAVGQCTTYGDMAGALAPIADLFKTRVYALARHVNSLGAVIPEAVLTKPASAELAPGQSDEAKFGSWSVLDPVLEMYLEKIWSVEQIIAAGFDSVYVRRIVAIVRRNEFKRNQSALVVKVTRKAFGNGRRFPLASRWRPFPPDGRR